MRLTTTSGILAVLPLHAFLGASTPSQRAQPRHVEGGIPLTLHNATAALTHRAHRRQSPEQIQEGNGKGYFADITLGASGQPFSVLFDTGSDDLWLLSAAGAAPGQPSVDTSDSSITPYGGGGVGCTLTYGAQSKAVSGTVWQAPYTIAGTTPTNVFCLADSSGYGATLQGIIGMGFCAGSAVSRATGSLTNCPLLALGWDSFGLYLSSDDSNGGGVITPNGADQSLVASDFFFESVLGNGGYWSFNIGSYSVNGQGGPLSTSIGFVDSGTSLILLAPEDASAIWSYVGAQSDGSIPCGQGGPDIEFTFGSGQTYNIPSNIWEIQNPTTEACRVAVGQIQNPNNDNRAVFGTPFTKAWYTFYDLNDDPGSYVGFARSIG